VPIYFHVCGIELNVAGRQRDGFIQPGSAEYEMLRDQIIQDALRLVDPQTGQPFVSEARRREALYSGPYVETFPDIILVLDPLYIGAGSLAGSQLVEPHPDPMRPGEHREAGVFMAAGPDIQVGNQIEDLALLDMPPTLLQALGLPIPGYFDGRSCQELFTADFRKANPLRIQEMDRPALAQESGAPLARQQEQELEDRLRGLGYLD
jgi:predicted AlkP superfamily phosphohydrolase/phosphomutase